MPPPKISCQSDDVKMPKLDFKVKQWNLDVMKNSHKSGDNAILWEQRVNHDPKVVAGVVNDLQKKFQLFFSSPCYLQKINKNFYHAKNHDFWFLEGKNLPLAYSNSIWLKIHLILETSNMIGPLFTNKNHFWLILVLTIG